MSTSKKLIATAAVALPLALLLAGCAGGGTDAEAGAAAENEVVRIGVVNSGDEYWDTFTAAAADEGIEVELVELHRVHAAQPGAVGGRAGPQPVPARHLPRHVQRAERRRPAADRRHGDLPARASTRRSTTSVDDIPEGATVAVPNDESNQARGLLVLQSAGLIELEDGGSIFSTVADVLPDSKVKVEAIDASFTATSLPDVAAAIVNNDFLEDAGLTAEDAIASGRPGRPLRHPVHQHLRRHGRGRRQPDVPEARRDLPGDARRCRTAWSRRPAAPPCSSKTPVDELVASLTDVEDDIRANS